MDLSLVTDNLDVIMTVATALFGTYVAKIKVAHGKVMAAIKELEDVQDTVVAAVADNKISTEEAERIGKEVKEAIVATHAAADSIMAIIPEKLRSKIRFKKAA